MNHGTNLKLIKFKNCQQPHAYIGRIFCHPQTILLSDIVWSLPDRAGFTSMFQFIK